MKKNVRGKIYGCEIIMGKKVHVFFQRSFSSIQGFFSEPAALHGVEVESSTAMHVFSPRCMEDMFRCISKNWLPSCVCVDQSMCSACFFLQIWFEKRSTL